MKPSEKGRWNGSVNSNTISQFATKQSFNTQTKIKTKKRDKDEIAYRDTHSLQHLEFCLGI